MEDKPKASELLAMGRRHYIVRDYFQSSEVLAKACEALAAEFGDTSDECAEAYLWYGKSLLGLSRGESGVIGDGVLPPEDDNNDDDEEEEDAGHNGEGDNEDNGKAEENAVESTEEGTADSTKGVAPTCSKTNGEKSTEQAINGDEAGPSDGNEEGDESVVDDNEDDVDNLQLAWEMLDLSRSILEKRGASGRALLAEVHLALGEVALESETYDKAIIDMQSCLDIQKEIYPSDNRRIAETHYQIGLANSLASNFDDAVTHFKNAANILETRIKNLEDPTYVAKNADEKDNLRTIADEIKELKELLPEIKEKIHDMMDYKAETIKHMRESLCSSNGDGASSSSVTSSEAVGFSSSSASKTAASDISHLIKRKRKSSETEQEASAPKRSNS